MAKLTLANLKDLIKNYLVAGKVMIDEATYTLSRETFTLLTTKIGKQIMLDSTFSNIMPELEAEELPYGTTIEDYFINLVVAKAYDSDGATALAPQRLDVEDPFYNELLGRKTLPVTVDDTEYQKAMLGEGEFSSYVAKIMSQWHNSYTLHTNQLKRQLLGRAYGHIAAGGNAATQVITKLKPTDTASGEAWTKEVKEIYTEMTDWENTKYNVAGVVAQSPKDAVYLYVKGSDILPVIDVDVLAGTFNVSKAEVPVKIVQVKDFGDGVPVEVYAMLVDTRGLKIHPHHITTTHQYNGEGEFTNYFMHFSHTAYVSPFVNMVVFKNN